MKKKRFAWLCTILLLTGTLLPPLGAPIIHAAEGHNLAQGKPVTASSHTDVYAAANVNDGNQTTYWESANNAFPQWVQVDLGTTAIINRVILKSPATWETRTQTLTVLGSIDGSNFHSLTASAAYAFEPVSQNTVTIDFSPVEARYVRVQVTANIGWPAAQLSELEIYGSSGGGHPAHIVPGKIEAEDWSAMRGIQTEQTSDVGGGWNIGWVHAGDWLEYDVNVQTAGTYIAEFRVASNASTGQFELQSDGTTLASVMAPNTGGWQNWHTVSTTVTLNAGEQTLRIYATGYDFNINWIQFIASGNTDIDPPTPPANLSYTEPAEGTIALSWQASTDNIGVTGYDIYVNDQLRGSVNGDTLTYTDQQPGSLTVTYYVIAKDAAGNVSAASNSVTRFGSGGTETNLALGKPIEASSYTHIFVAANASDDDVTTYWEASGHPGTLTVDLGANAHISSIVIKLNPDSAWQTRTQTIQVLGRDQDSSTFDNLVSASAYTFDPATQNTVTIPVSATVSSVQLRFTANSGAPGGQAAEFQVFGIPAPNPDLVITEASWTPSAPSETDAITLHATVHNAGTADAPPSAVNFYLNGTLAGTASVNTLAAGASDTVSVHADARAAGSYELVSIADEDNAVIELDDSNNTYTHPEPIVVSEVPSSDLTGAISWTPNNPSAGDTVSFSFNLINTGNIATVGDSHEITLTLKDSSGTEVQTFHSAYNGTLAPGASADVPLGTWTAVNGSYTVTATVSADANEIEARRGNNIVTASLYSGRGANMPFQILEAEAPENDTNGTVLAPNFQPGDFAGEASGRSAVFLDATGEYVEFMLPAPANAFVLRNAVSENTSGTISLYADGNKIGAFDVTSKFSYVYATPSTLGQLGYDNIPGGGKTAYWLYEDAQLLSDEVYPAGTKIRIQKDQGDVPWIYIDLLEIENVAPPAANPDPDLYVEVSNTKSIEQALQEFREDPRKRGIFIPAGEWTIHSKIFLYGRATEIIGAGPWHTRLVAPQNQTNTDVGFNISSSANGSTIRDLSAWGNYVYRVDGPGKFIDGNGMQHVTVDNVWAEHFICLYWGVNSSYNTFTNNRIKNIFADAINMTNGSSYNIIDNNYARATGDDAFALFSAIDAGGTYNVGNQYTNLTATAVRRAAAFAVYGGQDNLFQNLYGADTLTYPGFTISSLSFGYNTLGFGDRDTVIDGVTLDRTGGDFWTSVGADDKINDHQNFGAIWLFAGDRDFKNILIRNVDIHNPVYFGLMFQTKYPEQLPMQNVRLENIAIHQPTRYGIKLVAKAEEGQGPVIGSASFTNVNIYNPGIMPIYGEDKSPGFNVNRVSGNNW